MKKLILAAFALTTAASVFAQGTILFNNRLSASTLQTHVYAPLAGNVSFSQIGNGTADAPAGVTSWAGFTLIGTNLAGQYGGSSTMAQLLTGTVNAEASLLPQAGIVTFRTGAAAGYTQGGVTVTASNVGGDAAGFAEMAAWDNSSGLYPTWTLASVAWKGGLIAAGESGIWGATFGGTGTPPTLDGVKSFNLYFIPEPSTFALAGLGLAALVAFRRRS